jgi:Bacterial TSP3 repeat
MRVLPNLLILALLLAAPGLAGAWCANGAPPARDADDDGLNEIQESNFGTDPNSADTDADGVPDGQEDADGDGVPNEDEPHIFSFETFHDPFISGRCDFSFVIEGSNLFGLEPGLALVERPACQNLRPVSVSLDRKLSRDTRIFLRGLCRRELNCFVGQLRVINRGQPTNPLNFNPMVCPPEGAGPEGMAAAIIELRARVNGVRYRLQYIAIGGCELTQPTKNGSVRTTVRLPDHVLKITAPFGAFQQYPTRIIIPSASRAVSDPLYPFRDVLTVGDRVAIATRTGATAELPIEPVVAQLRIPAKNLRSDHDGDRLATRLELQLGTDPLVFDTDHDGLSDGIEVRRTGTDPLDPDSDDDGENDADAVRRLKRSDAARPRMGRHGGLSY